MILSTVTFLWISLGWAQSQNDQIIAVVGSKNITLSEFESKYKEVRSKAFNPPTPEEFLEDYVRYHVGLQEAYKKKLNEDPIVKDRMEQEMYKGLLEKELSEAVNKIQISEKDMKDYYRNNPDLRASHILIEFKADATPTQKAEARKRAEEIYQEVLKSKRPFEELVKLYSDDTLTKSNGGDLGFQNRATLIPSFYEALKSMKMGEIKGIIEGPSGYHIVKLTGIRSYENADKRALRAQVFDQKRKVLFDEYFNRLKKQYGVKTSPELLKKRSQ